MEAEQSAPALIDTPEFREAVRTESQKIITDLLKAAPSGAGASDRAFADSLAMAIAQLTDQGVKKRLSPEDIKARSAARAELEGLLVDARTRGLVAKYTLLNKVYLDEMLVDPVWIGPDHLQHPTEIEWPGVPSEAMKPANDIAERIFAAYKGSIGVAHYAPGEAPPGEMPMSVTAGGLVVRGAPTAGKARRAVGTDPMASAPVGGEGLRLPHREAQGGRYKPIHVLGTVAAPALQTV